jgi:hypothetical protein
MNQRWRSLLRPDETEPMDSPRTDEALGVWVLGAVWALACLGLGYLGGYWVIPGVLLAGLLALWGWRHMEWLWWFPVILVVATLLEPLSPLPLRSRFGPLVYIDLLAMGVALVAVVRSLVLKLPLFPRTPLDRLVVAILCLIGLRLMVADPHTGALLDFKRFVVGAIVFYAATTVASRPRGSRWIWTAFPMTSGLIGVHAVVATLIDPHLLATHIQAADRVWDSSSGLFYALVVALPVSIGLAFDAGRIPARALWMAASVAGAMALPLHFAVENPLLVSPVQAAPRMAFVLARMVVAFVALTLLSRLAWKVHAGRPHESPRWIAIMIVFAGFAVLQLFVPVLSRPVVRLLAVAGGLVVGTLKADRRAMRSGRRIGPEQRLAA